MNEVKNSEFQQAVKLLKSIGINVKVINLRGLSVATIEGDTLHGNIIRLKNKKEDEKAMSEEIKKEKVKNNE